MGGVARMTCCEVGALDQDGRNAEERVNNERRDNDILITILCNRRCVQAEDAANVKDRTAAGVRI